MDTRSKGRSDQGRRKNNEDFIAYFEPTIPAELKNYGCLYIVADGVGGAAKGERASQYAAEKILFDYYQPYEPDDPEQPVLIEPLGYLSSILKQVNEEIYEYATQNDTRMATTIVAAVVREGFVYVANVGDSRAYLIRDGVAAPLNRDHNLVGEMVEHGEMTEVEAMASSIKNRLTRSLGGDPAVTVDTYEPLRLQSGDKILLCTDGLTRYALHEDIAAMTKMGTPDEIAERLIRFANDSGGADNISVIVVSYQPNWALEQPAIPIARPHDVDLLDTEEPSYKKPRTDHGNDIMAPIFHALKERKWQAMIAMIIAIFAMVSVVGAVVKIAGRVTPTPQNTVAALSQTPPSSPSSTIASAISTVATENLILTPTETLLPSGLNYWCVSKVDANDVSSRTLYSILPKFQQSYDQNAKYEYCILNPEETLCSEPHPIDNHNLLDLNWSIVIPNVDRGSCNSGGGKWMQRP